MTETPEQVAGRLSSDQQDWLLSMEPNTEKQDRDYDTIFDVPSSIELSPEVRDPETGFLDCPADRLWLGSNGCIVGGRAWSQLNDLGLAVRAILAKVKGTGNG